jgi:NTP pyrophosphatase (non-canonical NTP hydrolase)
MTQLVDMTTEVVSWIRDYLPDTARDPVNTSIKLTEESSELTHSLYTGDGSVAEELADILILTLDIAHLHRINLEKAFKDKMEINRQRSWTKVKGALKHAPSR